MVDFLRYRVCSVFPVPKDCEREMRTIIDDSVALIHAASKQISRCVTIARHLTAF